MSEFHSLNVKEIKKETSDTVSISFDIPAELKNVYKFSGLALKNDTKVSESEFSAMITYK